MPSIAKQNGLSAAHRALGIAVAFTLLYASWLIFRFGGEEGLRYLSEVVYQLPPMAATALCALAALRTTGRKGGGTGTAHTGTRRGRGGR